MITITKADTIHIIATIVTILLTRISPLSHLSNENPDNPESRRDACHEYIANEIEKAVVSSFTTTSVTIAIIMHLASRFQSTKVSMLKQNKMVSDSNQQ
jgi:hypothetical protein